MALAGIGRQLAQLPTRGKLALMVAGDGIFLPLCAWVAASLGAPQGLPVAGWALESSLYLLSGLSAIAVMALAGLYRSVVRYIDQRVVAKTSAALAAAVGLLFAVAQWLQLSALQPVLLVYWFVAFAYLMASRLLARTVLHVGMKRAGRPRRRTLIYGAGGAGVQLAQAMKYSVGYQPACFVDDSPALWGRVVAGVRVYPPDAIENVVASHDVEQVVVAVPSAPLSERRRLINRMEALGLPVKVLPGLAELVDAEASVSDIRDIDVSDLLGRDPVTPNPRLFARNIHGKSVLVTGAGGSIGSELCRQILSQRPCRLVLLDHSEFALYSIEQELAHAAAQSAVELVAVLGSVMDQALLERVMHTHGVQTAYHAAAYKHVPIVESNVRQGVANNVFGSLAVARAAMACALETCVLVSTDKAVRPTNVMGATKRIAELVFQAAARNGGRTVFSMVRFGNVLGSSGSVVPLFKKQIQAGGPVTITHPQIIRYFMLIPEAAQLVIQAGAMAQGGEVFVLDMGEPVRIADMARTMIRLSGLTERTPEHPEGDIEIRFVGLRPGEKLYEELLIGDRTVPSDHPRIMCAHERSIEPVVLDRLLGQLQAACAQGDDAALLRQVRVLVPEYRTPEEVNALAPSDKRHLVQSA